MGAARQGQAPVFLYASHKKGRQTCTSLYLICKSGIYAVLKLYFGAEPRGYLWGYGVFSGWRRCPENVFCFLWLSEVCWNRLDNPATVCVFLMLSCCFNRFCISCNRHEAFLKSFRWFPYCFEVFLKPSWAILHCLDVDWIRLCYSQHWKQFAEIVLSILWMKEVCWNCPEYFCVERRLLKLSWMFLYGTRFAETILNILMLNKVFCSCQCFAEMECQG